jgi:hypothetical protein
MCACTRLGWRAAREAVKDRVRLRGEEEEAGAVVRHRAQLAALHDPLHLVDGLKAAPVRGEELEHRAAHAWRVEIFGHLVGVRIIVRVRVRVSVRVRVLRSGLGC